MKKIESLDNPLVKKIVQLHSSKGRKMHQQFIAEGERVCTTLRTSILEIVHIFATYAFLEKHPEWSQEPHLVMAPEKVLAKMSASVSPSGILVVFKIPQPQSVISSGPVLSHISDPGNMGTLIRSASAFGYKNCIIVAGADVWSPKVVQASAGMCGHINIITISWPDLLKAKGSLKLTGLVVENGKPITNLQQDDNRLIVVGSEAHGLTEQEVASCDELVTIPMNNQTESLNAAIAGSLAMYLLRTH